METSTFDRAVLREIKKYSKWNICGAEKCIQWFWSPSGAAITVPTMEELSRRGLVEIERDGVLATLSLSPAALVEAFANEDRAHA